VTGDTRRRVAEDDDDDGGQQDQPPRHSSLTAAHPGTPVAVLTARAIASASTSAAIAPSAVSETGALDSPVEIAST
jgi:hypothetical protein